MYESHFGLRQRPFRAMPDSDCYYPATTHERALARLLRAVAEDEGLCLVTGGPGMGKTLLGHRLLERLGPDVASAFLTNSHVCDKAGLLQAILFDLSLPYQGRNEQELRLSLTDCLLENYTAGRRSVFLVDEAQHLTPDALEELRLLDNLEARHGKAFQVILLAQPAIWETLRQPALAAFCQRLVVRIQLEPFSVHEAADYIVHHLRTAGGLPDRILSDEALQVLARRTQGVPRLLNQAAHEALCLAHSGGTTLVDAEAALEALAILGLDTETTTSDEEDSPATCPQRENTSLEKAGAPEASAETEGEKEAGPGATSLSIEGRRQGRLFAPPRRSA